MTSGFRAVAKQALIALCDLVSRLYITVVCDNKLTREVEKVENIFHNHHQKVYNILKASLSLYVSVTRGLTMQLTSFSSIDLNYRSLETSLNSLSACQVTTLDGSRDILLSFPFS